jgi:hypothetical protein
MGASARPRRARGGAATVAVVLVALAGGIGLLAFFVARDDAPVRSGDARGPGQAFADQGARHLRPGGRGRGAYNSSPPTSGPHVPAAISRDEAPLTDDQLLHALELGNVVIAYGTRSPPPGLRELARDVAGPFDPALARAGQAVILARRPGTRGVVALAWRHLLRAPSAADPGVRGFAEAWLGRGATG